MAIDNSIYIELENGIVHKSVSEEIEFYNAVADGDLAKVEKNCQEKRFLDSEGVGMLSSSPLQNIKYHFVITAALVARYCCEKGMPMELSFRMSDYYIRKMDTFNSIDDVAELHNQMVLDYATRMKDAKDVSHRSKAIDGCINYIYGHIFERITLDDLARESGLSTGYLSKLFKKEMNTSVSDYIRDQRIKQAKNMLMYTDIPIIEISDTLVFSSQSHFTQTFKRLVGMTPREYRDEHSQRML